MNKLIIIGCGGHARSVADVLLSRFPNISIVFVDENAQPNETILSFPVQSFMPIKAEALHVAIGDNSLREKWVLENTASPVSVISNSAVVSPSSTIEKGSFIAHGSYVGPLTEIGRGSIINTGALVEHEVKMEEFSHMAPNSTICGRCHIGRNVVLGAGSTIIDRVHVCNDVIIGANSTVISDITCAGTYVGSPVRRIK